MKAKACFWSPGRVFVLEVPQECVGRAMTDISRMEGGRWLRRKSRARRPGCGEKVPAACVGRLRQGGCRIYGRKGKIFLELAGYFLCHNAGEVIEAIGYDSEGDTGHPAGSVFCSHGAGYVVPWYEVEERCMSR